MIYNIYNLLLSDLPSTLITESVCLVGKGRLKERCGLEPRTVFFLLRNRQIIVRIRFENIWYVVTRYSIWAALIQMISCEVGELTGETSSESKLLFSHTAPTYNRNSVGLLEPMLQSSTLNASVF